MDTNQEHVKGKHRATKLALLHQILATDEKIDKITSYLDAVVNYDRSQIIKGINGHTDIIVSNFIGKVHHQIVRIEDVQRHLIGIEDAIWKVGSDARQQLRKLRKEITCLKKEGTNSKNQKKACTGLVTTPKSNWTCLKRLKSYFQQVLLRMAQEAP